MSKTNMCTDRSGQAKGTTPPRTSRCKGRGEKRELRWLCALVIIAANEDVGMARPPRGVFIDAYRWHIPPFKFDKVPIRAHGYLFNLVKTASVHNNPHWELANLKLAAFAFTAVCPYIYM